MKHQLQSSPGSSEVMIGCRVAWKCVVACVLLELSQQPTWPQVRHRRRCTQVSLMTRHSSQPSLFGWSVLTRFRCVHWTLMGCSVRLRVVDLDCEGVALFYYQSS